MYVACMYRVCIQMFCEYFLSDSVNPSKRSPFSLSFHLRARERDVSKITNCASRHKELRGSPDATAAANK